MEILKFPNSRLREKSKNFNLKDDNERLEIIRLVQEMQDVMYNANGVGLAAPQVGVLKKLFIIDIDQRVEKDDDGEIVDRTPGVLIIFINPEIKSKSGEAMFEEGCLSVPGIYEEVKRATKVEIEYYDLNFEKKHMVAEGFLADVIQHEYDHLEGKLFIDKLSVVKRTIVKNKILKGKNL
jgi:peptide deformylase